MNGPTGPFFFRVFFGKILVLKGNCMLNRWKKKPNVEENEEEIVLIPPFYSIRMEVVEKECYTIDDLLKIRFAKRRAVDTKKVFVVVGVCFAFACMAIVRNLFVEPVSVEPTQVAAVPVVETVVEVVEEKPLIQETVSKRIQNLAVEEVVADPLEEVLVTSFVEDASTCMQLGKMLVGETIDVRLQLVKIEVVKDEMYRYYFEAMDGGMLFVTESLYEDLQFDGVMAVSNWYRVQGVVSGVSDVLEMNDVQIKNG